ncbi:MAG: NADH-quinone oxidoreductase subunit A [Candidatus Thermoplasmatota archaeon]|nr:NADH-quinone oxidoreductase subunit A [Candidatus Thermoplasmatota archaeon]
MALELYYPVAVFVLIAIAFPFMTYMVTRLLRRDRPTPLKLTTYECGEIPEGEAWIQFNFQYYLFALMFIVFDVAAIFIILFALLYAEGLTVSTQILMLLFVSIITVATLYSLKKQEVYTI